MKINKVTSLKKQFLSFLLVTSIVSPQISLAIPNTGTKIVDQGVSAQRALYLSQYNSLIDQVNVELAKSISDTTINSTEVNPKDVDRKIELLNELKNKLSEYKEASNDQVACAGIAALGIAATVLTYKSGLYSRLYEAVINKGFIKTFASTSFPIYYFMTMAGLIGPGLVVTGTVKETKKIIYKQELKLKIKQMIEILNEEIEVQEALK